MFEPRTWVAAIFLACGISQAVFAEFPSAGPGAVSDAAFARAVIPIILGRRARGIEEIDLVASVSGAFGRETAVRMLMQDPAYAIHWADLLVDLLDVERGNEPIAQHPDCFGPPMNPLDDGSRAAFVRDNTPDTAWAGTPGNMTDLLRSAVVLDDLSVAYQAYLFPLAARRWLLGDTANAVIADRFMSTYLNRDLGCLGCHNRTFSMSNKLDGGGNVAWRRLWSIPGNVERALFGNYHDATGAEERLRFIFRGDARTSPSNGFVPWGMHLQCSSDRDGDTRTKGAFRRPPAGAVSHASARFAGLDGAADALVSIVDLERAFRAGVDELTAQGLVRTAPTTPPALPPAAAAFCAVADLTADTCVGCHAGAYASGGLDLSAGPEPALAITGSGAAANMPLVVPGDAAASGFYHVVANGSMPQGGPALNAADVELVADWINGGAHLDDVAICNSSHLPDVPANAAFAFQVAVNAVDRIWKTVMGERLTIDHGFARNEAQLETLWYLSEDVFVPSGWSLGDVLVAIVTSELFLRPAAAEVAGSPYDLPLLWDPWVEADPTLAPVSDPAAHYNSVGDTTHRHVVSSLAGGAADALGWIPPPRMPGYPAGKWPSLAREIGRYESPRRPGFDDVDFQTLLFWEDTIGACEKTNRTIADQDWIDRVVAGAAAYDAANPGAPLTFRDVYLTLKDWLIQDPTVAVQPPAAAAAAASEAEAVTALLNAELAGAPLTLESAAGTMGEEFLGTKLREVCGVLLKSPGFMLSPIGPTALVGGALPEPPKLRVCNAEPCTRAAMCEAFVADLGAIGATAYCVGGNLSPTAPPAASPPPAETVALKRRAAHLAALCPDSRCAFRPWKGVESCRAKPALCRVPPTATCDPRCLGPRCCGRLPVDPLRPGILSISATGAAVRTASAVSIAPVGVDRWIALKPGYRLQPGDVLAVPPHARLLAEDRAGAYAYDPTKVPALRVFATARSRSAFDGAVYLSIAGARDSVGKPSGYVSQSALRAPRNRDFFQSRGPSSREHQRITVRAARPKPRKMQPRGPTSGLALHLVGPRAASMRSLSAAELRPPPRLEVSLQFPKDTVQSVFCPNTRAMRCTPQCELSLPSASTCAVLGTRGPAKLHGKLELSRGGRLACAWRGPELSCGPTGQAPARLRR